MKQTGFTLIELLVVVAIIGILAAVGTVAYTGYTSAAKSSTTKANFELIYKTWVSEKAFCEINSTASALWNKTTCEVLLANNSSDYNRTSFIISNFYGLNNNYGNGQPTKNLFHKYDRGIYKSSCGDDPSNDDNIGYLISCYERENARIIFSGCFKSPCSSSENRILKYIYYD